MTLGILDVLLLKPGSRPNPRSPTRPWVAQTGFLLDDLEDHDVAVREHGLIERGMARQGGPKSVGRRIDVADTGVNERRNPFGRVGPVPPCKKSFAKAEL